MINITKFNPVATAKAMTGGHFAYSAPPPQERDYVEPDKEVMKMQILLCSNDERLRDLGPKYVFHVAEPDRKVPWGFVGTELGVVENNGYTVQVLYTFMMAADVPDERKHEIELNTNEWIKHLDAEVKGPLGPEPYGNAFDCMADPYPYSPTSMEAVEEVPMFSCMGDRSFGESQ